MNPTDLAAMLELMAAGLRMLPAGAAGAVASAAAQLQAAPAAPQRTLSEWIDVHEAEAAHRDYKAQTVRNRRSLLAHCRRLWGHHPIDALRPHDVAAGLREISAEHSSTAGRVLSVLRDVYSDAIANGWCNSSPAAHVKAPKHKVQRHRLTLDTWRAMRTLAKASSQGWLESMLLLALATGQRRADLAKMRFDDVVDGHLQVQQQKEAGKGYGARLAIPLTLRLDATGLTLAELIEHCRASAAPGPTLLRKSGGGAIEVSSLSARFAECICAVLGDADPGSRLRPSLHETRSLSARLYLAQGLPPATVQTLLGHKDLDMTQMYVDDRGLSRDEFKRVCV